MNIIETKAIGKLILNEHTPQREERREHYVIPYYQRGYRWDNHHVKALLEDIHNFILAKENKYCLQPIVVVPGVDKNQNQIWEVIDGQQRLITMHLIFKILGKPKYVLNFEKRNKSTEFLNTINPENYSDTNPDFYYLSEAYKEIKKWFDEKTRNDIGYIDLFNSKLTNDVEVIWYQIEELSTNIDKTNITLIEGKKIDIFNRLNIGKIPLSDAELVRALLLSKIKIGVSDREAILRQSELSNEWHMIEMELRNPSFWYFLNNSDIQKNSSAIEFIFKLIADGTDKKYSTYLWIEKKIRSEDQSTEKENTLAFWTKTKDYFSKLKYWYQDIILYHQIGFLLAIAEDPVKKLKEIIKNSDCTKSEFRKHVLTSVKESLAHIDSDELSYDNNKNKNLNIVLLLHNIISTYTDKKIQKNKFPFNLYKETQQNGGWSIEHIHAQASEEMKNENAIKKWLSDTYESIKEITFIEKIEAETNDYGERTETEKVINVRPIIKEVYELKNQDKIKIEEFNILKTRIIELFESDSVHELDNLALLSKKDNSSLNNAIFPVKRNRILKLEQEGRYIPQTTRNIFLKTYSHSDLQPFYWSAKDKMKYFEDIKNKLEPFLEVKDKKETDATK